MTVFRIVTAFAVVATVLNPAFAFAVCSAQDWSAMQKNLQWTIFDDADARRCHYSDDDDAYNRLVDCNAGFKGNSNGMKDQLNRCWPAETCNWIKAHGAPGC